MANQQESSAQREADSLALHVKPPETLSASLLEAFIEKARSLGKDPDAYLVELVEREVQLA